MMTFSDTIFARRHLIIPQRVVAVAAAVALGLALWLFAIAPTLFAQVEGDRGIAPVAASGDVSVDGIDVNVAASGDEDLRSKAWKEAQRKAWQKLGGPSLSDGDLTKLVSAFVVEREQISNSRYIARLTVVFDRTRTSSYLGKEGVRVRSAPLLLIPVTLSEGTQLVFERRNPWQRAWAEFQAGASGVNYIRPSGAGEDSLLVNYGQTLRRSRVWWRNILDGYDAADVVIAVADLRRRFPGGPIEGVFTARYGPDNLYLDSFKMTAANDTDLKVMLARAVLAFDRIYAQAIVDGRLKRDASLNINQNALDPAIARLLAASQKTAEESLDAAAENGAIAGSGEKLPEGASPGPAANVTTFTVQFASPSPGAFDSTLAGVRAVPGVKGASTSSLAIGGTSVMQVSFAGTLGELAAALRARGFNVNQGGNALAISR